MTVIQNILNNNPLPQIEKEILLAHVLKKDKSFLHAHSDYLLTNHQLTKYNSLTNRRLQGEPIQYLTNQAHFYGLEFFVDHRVLIPRVETEEMVELALEFIKNHPKATIVDVGTGSGNIIISLATHLPSDFKGKLFAIDVSIDALEVSVMNAQLHHLNFTGVRPQLSRVGDGPLIAFLHGNLLEPLKGQKADLILANLPYVRDHLYGILDPQITWEPKVAILGGDDGMKFYNELFKQLPKYLSPHGLVLYEVDGKVYERVISS